MPARRVLISIDERLLGRIDASCRERGLTRSGYLARLAAADLDHETHEARAPVRAEADDEGQGR